MKKLNKKIIRIIRSVILTISLIMGFIPLPLFSETVYAAKYEITVRANNYAGTYDGTEKSASGFVTLEFSVDGNNYTVSGLTTSDPKSTDVCNLTNIISGTPVVKDSNSNDVTDRFDVKLEDGRLKIRPRYVTLTSDSDAKIYDGTPLTNDYVTVGGDGFAPGEGATYVVTGSQTIVGNSDNSFSYTLNDNTKAGNYSISTLPGTLKVVSRTDKYKISPQANSKTVNYDGLSWEVTGFETDTYEVDGNTYTVSGLEAYANEKEVGEHPVNVTGTAVVKDSKGNDVTSEFEVTPKPGKLIIKSDIVQYTVTFKVENGEWNDGGSDDKTVTLSRKENEDLLLRLKAEDIPGVGNKPSSGFKAGEWDITPSTEMVISRDRVFTYTYDQKAPVSHTVTFKVENGTWNDGTTEDKKIILSGYEGDTLKLSADQIPLVGTKPDSEHKKGKWDVTPNIATEITGDTTYTYTYADKKMIKYTVTFKVENGEWDDGGSGDKVVTLSKEEAEDLLLLLKNEDIPAVGNKPSNGFKAGGWDTAPRTDLVISEDKTYTYTYAQKASISQNVTFKVENGTWNDGTTDDIKVILTGYEGDTLKLAEGDIPEVGDKPEDTYKTGGWDTVPVADTEITTDTTYTYSYIKKDPETEPETEPEPEPEPEKKVSGTLLTRMTAKGNKSLVLTWRKVKGAEGYDIFFTGCGTTLKNKVVRKIKGNKTFTWTKKKLLKGKKYKAYVKAWVKKDGKKTYVKKSPAVHAFTANGNKKYTNPKSITVKKKKITLKAGKSYAIKAKINKIDKKKSLMKETHGAALRYCSSNTKIAKVSSKGKITAKAPGKCKVYVYAINGVSKTIRVTVKEK